MGPPASPQPGALSFAGTGRGLRREVWLGARKLFPARQTVAQSRRRSTPVGLDQASLLRAGGGGTSSDERTGHVIRPDLFWENRSLWKRCTETSSADCR